MSIDKLGSFLEACARGTEAVSAERMKDLYRGVMLGVATGNALGIPVEGRSSAEIRGDFAGGIREVDAREKTMPWDDDVAQTVILAEAFHDRERLELRDLAGRLVTWSSENGRGMGLHTSRVIGALALGASPEEAARDVWEQSNRKAAGNGAIMRCAPVALRWRREPHRLIEESLKSAIVTHYDPRCIWSVVALTSMILCSINRIIPSVDDLAELLAGAGAPAEVAQAMHESQPRNLESLHLDGPDMGYTLKAMQVAIWALRQESDFENVLIKVVNGGGDTDTNGAVAGAVMGSRVGAAAIPSRWLENIRDTNRLVALADGLLAASEKD